MKNYFLLVILLSCSSMHASDPLADLPPVNKQEKAQSTSTDLSHDEQSTTVESPDEDSSSNADSSDDTSSSESSNASTSDEDSDEDSNEDSDEDPDSFPLEEYEHYMDLIQKIDPIVYGKLRDFETKAEQQALEKTTDPMKEMVLPPSDLAFGYPFVVIKSLLALSEQEQRAYLTTCIAEYNDTLSDTFSESEYTHYIELIKIIDISVAMTLLNCATALKSPCLLKATPERQSDVLEGTEETFYYPRLVLPSIKTSDFDRQISFLTPYITRYKADTNEKRINNSQQPLPANQRIAILEIINSLAPALFHKIITVDPTGENHINRCAIGAKIIPSCHDGLPIVSVCTEFFDHPLEEQRWVIGHELGHYVLEHFKNTSAYHPLLHPKQSSPTPSTKKEDVSFKDTFKKTFSRIKENEADRFAIMQLDTSIDAAVGRFKRHLTNEIENKGLWRTKKTFDSTHPLWEARIAHLESLRREVELQKAHADNPVPINWDTIIEKYKTIFGEEMQEEL